MSSEYGASSETRSLTLSFSISTFGAVLLDLHIYRKTNRQGKYLMPEDDKEAQRLNALKTTRIRGQGYEAPIEENAPGGSVFESDISYHNRYGAADEDHEQFIGGSPPNQSLMENRSPQPSPQPNVDMGYHNRFFQPPSTEPLTSISPTTAREL